MIMTTHTHTHTHTKANGVGLPLRGHDPPVPKDQDP